jgi:hypothetical protein
MRFPYPLNNSYVLILQWMKILSKKEHQIIGL